MGFDGARFALPSKRQRIVFAFGEGGFKPQFFVLF
jgi:hypothetical protein